MNARAFPNGFLWGAATAAYQVEGAVAEGGRGPSIWDTFSHTPGTIAGGETGDVATDHYHRYLADVDLMISLGLTAYRFSIAWPRVQPDGRGPANPAGLDFYDRLVDALQARGVTPLVTLYHWDLPQALEDAGGWPVRDTAARFADYAALVHDALGDRVDLWSTMNEPWCSAYLGYASGHHAPGRREPAASLAAMHHLLLGHGMAVNAMRSTARKDERFAIALNLVPMLAASDSAADQAAARQVDGMQNRAFLDPILRGSYPADVIEATRDVSDWGFVRPGDAETIATPIDLLGVNYYFPLRVAAAPEGSGDSEYPGTTGAQVLPPEGPLTDMGWEVRPAALTELLGRLQREYGIPMLITENGAAYPDVPEADGTVRDPLRVAYLEGHISALHDAITAGADVRGYFAWSLMDNFEWAHGYAMRFGLFRVDYTTLARHWKDSAHWYGEVARGNGLP
jgi:beta-glucosidase